ncbi:hypothetical protein DH2020_040916 [Rehmannia glutinosa]|uniref:Uncharacterized protein n=1 Tax=Rehmannia glutinosa TaxID=99300 RepID=A0ABR0USU7_REHGL
MAKPILQTKSSTLCFAATGAILIFCALLILITPSPWPTFSSFFLSKPIDTKTFYDDPNIHYTIDKPMINWDENRKNWLKNNPTFVSKNGVLVVTGSQPSACKNPFGDHLLLRCFKNKVDYCRIHGYDIFYNNAFLDPQMRSYWAKIPILRAAMVAHPEVEWLFWVDSDAIFTDMEFRVPFERYKDHNLVVHGWPNLIYEKKSWVAVNAGVFLIRNCQWAMDFLDVWAGMGPRSPDYSEWGRVLRSTLKDKLFPESDDQSALKFDGDEENSLRRLRRRHAEAVSESYAAERQPFVTHFTGCQPCSGDHNPAYEGNSCWVGMERALNFADNQVLRNYGFVHPDVGNGSFVKPLPF